MDEGEGNTKGKPISGGAECGNMISAKDAKASGVGSAANSFGSDPIVTFSGTKISEGIAGASPEPAEVDARLCVLDAGEGVTRGDAGFLVCPACVETLAFFGGDPLSFRAEGDI